MKYYVNKNSQNNGDHEVHKEGCLWLPLESNRIYLGEYNKCNDAVKAAGNYYDDVDGCAKCVPQCHES